MVNKSEDTAVEADVKSTPKQEEPKHKFKYLCDGCTNPAFTSDKKEVGKSVTCACGKTQTTREENFVAL